MSNRNTLCYNPSIEGTNRLIWDQWNISHIARHGATPEEVEELATNDPIVSEAYGGRLRLIGKVAAGRVPTVIVAPKETGGYYVVTARPASCPERRFYEQQKGGEQAA